MPDQLQHEQRIAARDGACELGWHDWTAIPGASGQNSKQRVRALRRQRGDSHRLDPEIRHRSEEHTSELQSRQYLVCRLLLERNYNGAAAAEMRIARLRSGALHVGTAHT